MKKIYFILVALFASNVYAQTVLNADQISEGVENNFIITDPVTLRSCAYFGRTNTPDTICNLSTGALGFTNFDGEFNFRTWDTAPNSVNLNLNDSLFIGTSTAAGESSIQSNLPITIETTGSSHPINITATDDVNINTSGIGGVNLTAQDGVSLINDTVLKSTHWGPGSVLYTNPISEVESIYLEKGQLLGGVGSPASPGAIELIGGENVTVDSTQDGSLVINANVVNGAYEFNCAFNAGSPSGTTDFVLQMEAVLNGDAVTMEFPSGGATVLQPGNLSTLSSHDPSCVPVDIRPDVPVVSPVLTVSGTAPQLGYVEVDPSGDITIFHTPSTSFPALVYGGIGVAPDNPKDQAITYLKAPPGQTFYVGTAVTGSGTINPTRATYREGTDLNFTLTPDPFSVISAITDNCGFGGEQGGSLVNANTYSFSGAGAVYQDCVVSVSYTSATVVPVQVRRNTTNINTAPPNGVWYVGYTTGLDFEITATGGYTFTITDNCNAGSPGGSLTSPTNYHLSTVTAAPSCAISITGTPPVLMVPVVVTTTTTNVYPTPPDGEWFIGDTTGLDFTINTLNGYTFTATDNCNAGSPGGSLTSPNNYHLSTVTDAPYCTISLTGIPPSAEYIVNAVTSSGGTLIPSSQKWIQGTTTQLDFTVTPSPGYTLKSITDDCVNGSSPAGILSGNIYTIGNTINQPVCSITPTFELAPVTYTISTSNIGVGLGAFAPTSASYTPGVSGPVTFSGIRNQGSVLNPYSWTDDCNAGSPGGTLSMDGRSYTISTVTQNCTLRANFINAIKQTFFDFTALGSIPNIDPAAFLNAMYISLAFPDITTATVNPTWKTNIVTLLNSLNGQNPYVIEYAIGGATYNRASFAAVGFDTVIANIEAQISDINASLNSTAPRITAVGLDLEGGDWLINDVSYFADAFKTAGFKVGGDPQIDSVAGQDISSANPTSMQLTTGYGANNNYGLPLSVGLFDYISIQAYNNGAVTIDGQNQGSPNFIRNLGTALNNVVRANCTGSDPLCIENNVAILIGTVANAGAGGSGPGARTLFNPTGAQIYPSPPNSIPAYNQTNVLNSLHSALKVTLDNNPYILGMMEWSVNNDYSPLLYNPSDMYAIAGNFNDLIYGNTP